MDFFSVLDHFLGPVFVALFILGLGSIQKYSQLKYVIYKAYALLVAVVFTGIALYMLIGNLIIFYQMQLFLFNFVFYPKSNRQALILLDPFFGLN